MAKTKKQKQSAPPASSPAPASPAGDRTSPPAPVSAESTCKRCNSTEITKRTFQRELTHSGVHYVWNLLKCKCGQVRPERLTAPAKVKPDGR
jgi:hypothetical protein